MPPGRPRFSGADKKARSLKVDVGDMQLENLLWPTSLIDHQAPKIIEAGKRFAASKYRASSVDESTQIQIASLSLGISTFLMGFSRAQL
jgi:hypothetical protein